MTDILARDRHFRPRGMQIKRGVASNVATYRSSPRCRSTSEWLWCKYQDGEFRDFQRHRQIAFGQPGAAP